MDTSRYASHFCILCNGVSCVRISGLSYDTVVSGPCNDNHLHILVEDDGPGIPAAMRSAVFDRGQRADTLRPGQGVGLSVARDIVAQYDGRILAEDSLLGGACMEVIFGRQAMDDKEN